MKKKVISMLLTACTVSAMVVGGGFNLVMADDEETVTLMGWYDAVSYTHLDVYKRQQLV